MAGMMHVFVAISQQIIRFVAFTYSSSCHFPVQAGRSADWLRHEVQRDNQHPTWRQHMSVPLRSSPLPRSSVSTIREENV